MSGDSKGGDDNYTPPESYIPSSVNQSLLGELSPEDQSRVIASATAREAGVPYVEDSGLNQTDFFGQDYYVPEAIDRSIPAFMLGSSGSFSLDGGGAAPASSPIDYNVPAPDFGDLSYLNQPAPAYAPEAAPAYTPSFDPATFDPATYAPQQPSQPAASPEQMPGYDSYAQADNSGLPPNATPAAGPAPPAFDWATLNYGGGPAGASGAPNVTALNAAPVGSSTWDATPVAGPSGPSGASAAGGGGLGAMGSSSGDLSATDPNNNIPQWSADGQRYLGASEIGSGSSGYPGLPGTGEKSGSSSSGSGGSGKEPSWLDSLGLKNPVGTAIAAGGLINSMLQSRAMTNALKSPTTGASPGQSLAELAAPAMAQGREVTTTGVNNAVAGIGKLNDAATQNQQTGTDLIKSGQNNVQTATNDLRTAAVPLSTASEALLKTGPQNVAGAAANDLAALAAPPTATASTLQDRGVGLTGYVGTGTLPAGLQAQLDQGKSDARVGIISKYANRGMPTDPAKNSSLRMELQDLDRRTIAQGEQMAAELAKTGNTLTGTGLNASQVAGGLQTNRGQIGTTATGQGIQAGAAAGQLAGAAGGLGQGTTGAGVNVNQLAGTNLANANTTATSLVNSGITESGLAATTYTQLAKMDQEQSDRTTKAIQAMAASLAGGKASSDANNSYKLVATP